MDLKNIKAFNAMAELFRNQGNELFKQKQYLEAIEKYTASIDYANDDLNTALAYGNRSAAHIELGMYNHCMYDIEMALKSNFPQSKVSKLLKRKSRCGVMLTDVGQTKRFKENRVAEILRNQGNTLFRSAKYLDALLLYNESICYAEDDLNLALSYANRSAAYLELEHFPQCLRSIELAREHGYPAEKMSKLDDRKMKCSKKMTKSSSKASGQNLDDVLKLSYKPNPKIPFIIDCLKLRENAKYGRHIVTNRDLNPGDIIASQSCFVQTVMNPPDGTVSRPLSRYRFCSHCLKENRHDLIPCSTCNVAMFCNKDCAAKAQAHSFHRLDCTQLALIANQCMDYPFPFKMCDQALATVDGSFDELEKLYNESLESPKTIFDFDLSNPNDPEYAKNQLRVVLGMAKNMPPCMEQFLDMAKLYYPRVSARPFMRNFLKHLYEIGYAVGCVIELAFDCENETTHYGNVICLCTALFNHSCNPNVQGIILGSQRRFIVIRPIAKGEQIFDCCSTAKFYEGNTQDRTRMLRLKNFICKCEACENPQKFCLLEQLNVYDQKLYRFAMMHQNPLEKSSKKEILNMVQTFKYKLKQNYSVQRYPSKEYIMLLNAMLKYIAAADAWDFFKAGRFST